MPRALIEPRRGDKRFVRRAKTGQFKESDDVGARSPQIAVRRRSALRRRVRETAGTSAAAEPPIPTRLAALSIRSSA
jgi:hypothetical protein